MALARLLIGRVAVAVLSRAIPTPQEIASRELGEIFDEVEPAIEEAARDTVSAAVAGGRATAVERVKGLYTVEAAEVDRSVATSDPPPSGYGGGTVTARGSARLSLLAFTPTRAALGGIRTQIRRDRQPTRIPHAFEATVRGHRGIFKRRWWALSSPTFNTNPAGPHAPSRPLRRPPTQYGRMPRVFRLPVQELEALGVSTMVAQPPVLEAVGDWLTDQVDALFHRRLTQIANG